MDRRSFIRLAVAGSAAGIIAPEIVLAGSKKISSNPMSGGIFYTKDSPGRWAKKAGPHSPVIQTSKSKGGIIVDVVTSHPMKGYKHYIVKHMLLDKDFNFIDEKVFDPMKDSPVSQFTLKSHSGPIYALSVCNLHDSWLSVAEV
ncbi:MAG: hypothetical protein KAT25_04595 [Sulfuriflexus sp.]|nr:hypothetical protein [Sulfuriflexus sp.]